MDDETNVTELNNKGKSQKQTAKSILQQIQSEVEKGAGDKFKAAAKGLYLKRAETVKALALIDAELKELSDKFESGEL